MRMVLFQNRSYFIRFYVCKVQQLIKKNNDNALQTIKNMIMLLQPIRWTRRTVNGTCQVSRADATGCMICTLDMVFISESELNYLLLLELKATTLSPYRWYGSDSEIVEKVPLAACDALKRGNRTFLLVPEAWLSCHPYGRCPKTKHLYNDHKKV